jgi:hypothetical protein
MIGGLFAALFALVVVASIVAELDRGGPPAMSEGFVMRWPVRQMHTVTAADLDAGGNVSDETLERWVSAACPRRVAPSHGPGVSVSGERSETSMSPLWRTWRPGP